MGTPGDIIQSRSKTLPSVFDRLNPVVGSPQGLGRSAGGEP